MKWRMLSVAALRVIAMAMAAGSATAQEAVKVKISRFTFPGPVTVMLDVIKERGIDREHRIDLEPRNYSTIAAYYAAATTNEVDLVIGRPHVLQKCAER